MNSALCYRDLSQNPVIKPLWNGLINIVLHKWENNLKRKIKIRSKIKLEQTWINAINLSILQNMTLLTLWLPFLVYIASPVILRILFLSPEDSFMKKTSWAITLEIWHATPTGFFWTYSSRLLWFGKGKVQKQSLKNVLTEFCFA